MKSKKYVTYVKKNCLDENDENENAENVNDENDNENDENEKDEKDKKFKKYRKVKDHCHYTGKFRGAAYSDCNLKYKMPKNIPIVIHNSGYATHFIINQLAE